MKAIQRDQSIDFLKAVSIISVLIWHLQPLQFSYNTPKTSVEKIVSLVIHVGNSHFLCLAVPTFFMTALVLFIRKLSRLESSTEISYFKDRLKRISGIYVIYLCLQFFVFIGLEYASQQNLTMISYLQTPGDQLGIQISDMLWSLVWGGPRLPISSNSPLIANSAFYFLSDLLMLTVLCFLFEGLTLYWKKRCGVLISILTTIYFMIAPMIGAVIYAYRLENFLIYIPLASFWAHYPQKFLSLRRYYLVGFIVFCLLDQYLNILGLRGELYSRASIIFGCLSFVSYTTSLFHEKRLSESYFRMSSAVDFLAKHSLGIYAWHQYVMLTLWIAIKSISSYLNIPLNWYYFIQVMGLRVQLSAILFFASTVVLTIGIVFLIARSRLKFIVT